MPANLTTHPSTETLHALSLGKLDDAEARVVLGHLESCPDCCKKAAGLPGDSFLDKLRDVRARSETPLPNQTASGVTESLQAPGAPEGGAAGVARPFPSAGSKAARFPEEFPAPFGRYRILKLLGKGGMGAVYLAHDTQLDRSVALKVPHFEADDGPQVLERFYREARAAATILHPNICPLHDVGEIDGTPYLTMAYVEGRPLDKFAAARPLIPRQGALLVRKLALALQEAHKRGVIHRDLKPANVMIDKRGEPIIMDFGLARRTRTADPRLTQKGAFLGTPAYAPPEQVSGYGEGTGPASDVYSLGVMLYELLTGQLPFRGDTMAMLSQVLLDEPPPPSSVRAGIDPELEAICLKAMAKKVEDRYESMAEFAAALTDFLRAKPSASEPMAAPAPKPKAASEAETEGIRVSQLGGLRSVAMAPAQLPARKGAADKPRRPRPKRAGRRRIPAWAWLVGAGVGVALLLLGLWAGGVFKVKTKDGTIVLENLPPDAEVVVDGGLVTVQWDGGKAAEIRVSPGKPHRLEVRKDGFKVFGEEVELDGGGRKSVLVRLERKEQRNPIEEKGVPLFNEKGVPFFNGQDLSGWEGLPGYWDVKDGAIVGRCPPGKPAHTFLVSQKKYRDFDLKFEARRLDGVGNSGVQFRSRLTDAGKYTVVGPQVEIDSADFDYPPGSLLTEPNLDPLHVKAPRAEVARTYRDADFNAFHVCCVGKHVTIRVNGVTTIDDDFPSLPEEGVIAWQLHGKMTPKEVTFRNVRFTDLSRGAEGFVPLFNGKDLDGWEKVGKGDWTAEDGILHTRGDENPGWLATRRDYGDFELELEYRLGPKGNSGVFVHAWKEGAPNGGQFLEIQLIDDQANDTVGKTTGTAAIYGVLAPKPTVQSIPNTWHKLNVWSKGRRLQVSFDNRPVLDANLDDYPNFVQRFPGLKMTSGRIGLQHYGTPVEFRNIKIKELSASGGGQ